MSLKLTEKSLSSERKCVFCNLSVDDELKFGKIYEYDGIITHYYCLLLSSNMQQRGRDEDGILGFLPVDIRKELKRGQRLICTYCKKNGATLGCCNRKCKKVFHYPCGIKNNTLHQFFEEYKSFCVIHRPKQIVDVDARNIAPEHPMCYICYDHVHRDNIYQTLWAPCCKKNAWFHRDCVQRLALSAGYFFKCPLCNNNKAFQKAMLDSGIYVPSQDASWELVPNAFQELLYRHNKCDADKCKCPQGREYTSSNAKWELTLCRTCGSQGIHIECGNLRLINPVWDCDECSTILNKSNVRHNSNRIQSNSSSNTLTKESDDESSDSDISIGQELSLDQSANNLNCTDIILRPGPRSAKLKQLQEHAKMTTINTTTSNTSIEQLTDILNEQQAAHQSISDEILLTNSTGCKSSTLNTNVTIPENTTSNRLPTKKVIEDIIIVDSDDDNDNNDNNRVIKPPEISSTSNNTESPNDMSDCTISYMNIKISGVTSLSTEISTNTYNTSSKSTIAQGTSSNSQQMNPSTYLMKRKADSSDVVSMIVRCINDSIDSPDVTLKKQKIDNNGYHNSPAVLSRGSNSILRGVTGGSYRNGISLPETAVLAFHGKEFVVPLENSMSTVTSSNIIDENSSQSASDGDAGPKQAGFMYQPNSCTWRKVITTESSGYPDRRCCSDHGNGDYTENKRINDDSCSSSSSGESDTGIDRDRLMQKKVLLRDLKFHICNNNIITVFSSIPLFFILTIAVMYVFTLYI